MSTKSHARARRRHPELANDRAIQAVGESILNAITLGMLEPDTEVATPDSKPASIPESRH